MDVSNHFKGNVNVIIYCSDKLPLSAKVTLSTTAVCQTLKPSNEIKFETTHFLKCEIPIVSLEFFWNISFLGASEVLKSFEEQFIIKD